MKNLRRRLTFRTLRIYLFELVIIFFGITFSFLFEQWRQDNAGRKEIANHLNLILLDIDDLENSNKGANKSDSVERILFDQVKNRSITKDDLQKLVNRLDTYTEYSTTSFSIIRLSQSNLFEKLKDEQRIVAFVQLITERINRQNELRIQSDKLFVRLLSLSKFTSQNSKLKYSVNNQSKIELNISETDYQTLLNDNEFHSILNEFSAIKLQHRLSQNKMIELSTELKSFIKEYQNSQ